jgi:hypothetical protein
MKRGLTPSSQAWRHAPEPVQVSAQRAPALAGSPAPRRSSRTCVTTATGSPRSTPAGPAVGQTSTQRPQREQRSTISRARASRLSTNAAAFPSAAPASSPPLIAALLDPAGNRAGSSSLSRPALGTRRNATERVPLRTVAYTMLGLASAAAQVRRLTPVSTLRPCRCGPVHSGSPPPDVACSGDGQALAAAALPSPPPRRACRPPPQGTDPAPRRMMAPPAAEREPRVTLRRAGPPQGRR